MKKISLILALTICSATIFTACGNGETAAKVTTETTTTQEETTAEEEATTQEETTTQEDKVTEGLSINLVYDYPFLVDYKDFILEYFNDKSFKTGDVIDCKAEIEALGLDVNEYGNVFSAIYSRLLGGSQNCNFTIEDYIMDDIYGIPIVDVNNNLAATNNTDAPFHLEISFGKDRMNYYVVFD